MTAWTQLYHSPKQTRISYRRPTPESDPRTGLCNSISIKSFGWQVGTATQALLDASELYAVDKTVKMESQGKRSPCNTSLKQPAEKHPARSLPKPFLLLRSQDQVMGCVASTERQGEWRDTAFQSLRELQGVLRWFLFYVENSAIPICTEPDWLPPYRWSGLRSTNLIIGVDFTRSNMWNGKQSFGGRSLHFIDPAGVVLNPYQVVIDIIGRTLQSRKSKKPIHVFGFGDSFTADQCVFTFLPDGSPCRGVDHVLKRYKEITPGLVLGGPTNFAPIIYHAIRQAKASGTCQILVIIADGQVTSEKETSQAIVEASKYALSIIVVGVGDGPWEAIEEYKATLPKRKFENFHFVNLNQVINENPEQPALGFATAALAHIPDQLAAIRRLGLLQPKGSDQIAQRT